MYEAALLLEEHPDTAATRTEILAAVLQLVDQRPGTWASDVLYIKARCHQWLGQTSQALDAYREAVDQAPEKTSWRYEFSQLLFVSGKLQEARRQLVRLLQLEPGNGAAQDLYKKVLQRVAEGE
jgi:tetratricopeptide (TPR) repeat protein